MAQCRSGARGSCRRASVQTSSRARSRRSAGSAPPFELLESKLRAPRRRSGAVQRKALIGELEEASAAVPVVFLSAGPGWGKTTLLAQWSSRSPRPFAWVSVDENDNDPIVLLTYVAAALDRVTPLDASVFDALASPGTSVEGTVIPRLGAALAMMDKAVVLVLDDVHLLDSPPCLDAIVALIGPCPRGLAAGALRARPHRVPAGSAARAGPGAGDRTGRASLGRGRSAPAPASEPASTSRMPRSPSSRSTRRAGPRVCTWQRSRPSASGAGAEGATAFRGDDHFLADYLRSELLSQLPRDELRFLTRTAVLERMTGPLCDAVLESSDSAASSRRSSAPTCSWLRWTAMSSGIAITISSRSCCVRSSSEASRSSCRICSLVRRTGARRTGSRRPRSGTRRPPAMSTAWRDWWCAVRYPTYHSGRAATVEGWLAWLAGDWATEPDAAVAVIGGLIAALWGRPAEAERWADAAERATTTGAARRQRFDRLVAGPPACGALSSRGREDAHRRRGRSRDTRPREPVPAERAAGARDLALAGRRGRPGRRPARRRHRGRPRAGRRRRGDGGPGRARR